MKNVIKSILFILLFSAIFANCKEKKQSPKIDEDTIASKTGKEIDKVIENKLYNVTGDSNLENIVVYKSGERLYLSVFDKKEQSFALIKTKGFDPQSSFMKLMFVNPGLGYSHFFLVLKKEAPYILLFDLKNFEQKIPLGEKDLSALYLKKYEDAPNDELILIGKKSYRFDGIKYIENYEDITFPFLQSIQVNGEKSRIIMRNRGAYTGRAFITMSFIDLKGKNYLDYVKQTKDIKTVELFGPGKSMHQKGGGRTRAEHPVIEITKEPWARNQQMNLPLFLKKEAGRFLLRVVYQDRGIAFNWPDENSDVSRPEIEIDQQGYPAYVIDLADY